MPEQPAPSSVALNPAEVEIPPQIVAPRVDNVKDLLRYFPDSPITHVDVTPDKSFSDGAYSLLQGPARVFPDDGNPTNLFLRCEALLKLLKDSKFISFDSFFIELFIDLLIRIPSEIEITKASVFRSGKDALKAPRKGEILFANVLLVEGVTRIVQHGRMIDVLSWSSISERVRKSISKALQCNTDPEKTFFEVAIDSIRASLNFSCVRQSADVLAVEFKSDLSDEVISGLRAKFSAIIVDGLIPGTENCSELVRGSLGEDHLKRFRIQHAAEVFIAHDPDTVMQGGKYNTRADDWQRFLNFVTSHFPEISDHECFADPAWEALKSFLEAGKYADRNHPNAEMRREFFTHIIIWAASGAPPRLREHIIWYGVNA